MDAKNVGQTIAALRKAQGITQLELAEYLNVSNRTVSKWESGQGFPEITQFPLLSKLFGVSIDYLMTGKRSGITVVGNILTDQVKSITHYPEQGMLAKITATSRAVGGCVPNVLIDLARIDPSLPLSAVGRVGNDENGRFVLEMLNHLNINTDKVAISTTSPTSYTDVMSLPTGERTFFYAPGANAEFAPEDVDLAALNCSILHAGYILLLEQFDREDDDFGTKMARFFHNVREKGIKTSVDIVSNESADYAKWMLPVLPQLDYVIVNEFEACRAFGLESRLGDMPHIVNIEKAMRLMGEAGVGEKVVVHCKEGGFCLDTKTGNFSQLGSLILPEEEIKGSVGAGDAFCAGCLYSFLNGYSDMEALSFATAAAARNLFSENSVDGMRSKDEIRLTESKYLRRNLA